MEPPKFTRTNKTLHIVVIVGSIAAGKTTLVDNLSKNVDGSTAVYEPVDLWSKDGALQAFYDNMKANAAIFQTYAFITRIKSLNDVIKRGEHTILFCDASIHTDRHVFKAMLKEAKFIDEMQDVMYERTFEGWSELILGNPTYHYLYLNTPVERCAQQATTRGREEEKKSVDKSYLEKLGAKFDQFFDKLVSEKESGDDINVAKIDGDKDIGSVTQQALRYIREWGIIEPST